MKCAYCGNAPAVCRDLGYPACAKVAALASDDATWLDVLDDMTVHASGTVN
jgi:hypothetical protein